MTKRNFTSNIKFSPEFVRRSPHGGLELVQRTGNSETVTPVQTTTRGSNSKRLVVGLEVRSILVSANGDFSRVVELV